MTKRCLVSTLLLSTALILPACGSDGGDGDGDTSSDSAGDGDAEASTGDSDSETTTGDTTDSGDGDSADTTDSGDGDTSDTTDTTDNTGGDGDSTTDTTDTTGGDGDSTTGSGDCMAWQIVYDLDGSEFEITDTPLNGAGDMVVAIEAPYSDADNIGPGTVTLMIADNNGSPGDGAAFLVDYDVTMNFQTGSSGTALVTQTLEVTTADECGAAVGTLSGTDLTWSPNVLKDYNSTGNINCQGTFCGSFGAPDSGDTPVNETSDIDPFSAFTFSNDLSSFTAPDFTTSSDNTATTLMDLVGTETGRTLVAAPACICE